MKHQSVEWFVVEGVGHESFVAALRIGAASWPRAEGMSPANTGGWVMEDGSLITYADVSDPHANAVLASFRADFDGTRAFAARVAPAQIQEGSLFGGDRPEGDSPEEVATGGPEECAAAVAAWYRHHLFCRPR